MRSVKLLVAMAAVAALVAGPVLAQEAPATGSTEMAPSSTMAPAKTTAKKHSTKKHTGKKHAKKSTTAPATTTPAQ